MNLDEIEKKCFILALFIRDDGERFLLGSRMFEFLDSQLHFSGNNYQNDIVEVQGNDGVMLAGQVRRGSSQSFDGYIGDSSVDRSTIEQYRRSFFQFFRKNHYYKVVYIFTDGTAIQRRQGFIVEAPEVKELYQLFPQYHISMNFEDINYYNYEEDSEGQEIYGESATLKVITSATGGLIWEAASETTISGEGSSFTLQDTIEDNVLESVTIKGDTTQQTYSGKNIVSGFKTALANLTEYYIVNAKVSQIMVLSLKSNTSVSGATIYIRPTSSASAINVGNIDLVSGQISSATIELSQEQLDAIHNGNNGFFQLYKSGAGFDNITLSEIQLETGSQPTSYEPYVGGTASPNPDYPQPVQVVTGRQNVTITDGASESQTFEINLGKNLFNVSAITENTGATTTGVENHEVTYASNTFRAVTLLKVEPNSSYTLSIGDTSIVNQIYIVGMKSPTLESGHSFSWQTDGAVLRTTVKDQYLLGVINVDNGQGGNIANITNASIQIEKGSTASSYASYFTPIELCKIGTYQDYIYKSSGNWYVHKDVVKISPDGTESWNSLSISNPDYIYCYTSAFDAQVKPKVWDGLFSDKFIVYDYSGGGYEWISPSATIKSACFSNGDNSETINLRVICPKTTANSVANFKTWLGTSRPVFYYPIKTPTDTQITNADLITQLEALASATTYDGQTVFTVSSPNQLAILNVSVIARTDGGVVWDNYGAEWEEGTGGGPTMIDIESIDNVYPVWELTGPAVNPQISVLNTNTILSYTGTVTASQTLKIDMFNKTATLNGASVIGNVSGDWVYLEPGINRLTYTTSNADAPDSTIWWQEIVG